MRYLAALLVAGVIIALAALMIGRYGDAREDKGRLSERLISAERVRIADAKAFQGQLADKDRTAASIQRWGQRALDLQPIVIRATDKVTIYAATPDGNRPCLPAERVRDIEADRAALFPAAAASDPGAGAGPVPADPAVQKP